MEMYNKQNIEITDGYVTANPTGCTFGMDVEAARGFMMLERMVQYTDYLAHRNELKQKAEEAAEKFHDLRWEPMVSNNVPKLFAKEPDQTELARLTEEHRKVHDAYIATEQAAKRANRFMESYLRGLFDWINAEYVVDMDTQGVCSGIYLPRLVEICAADGIDNVFCITEELVGELVMGAAREGAILPLGSLGCDCDDLEV